MVDGASLLWRTGFALLWRTESTLALATGPARVAGRWASGRTGMTFLCRFVNGFGLMLRSFAETSFLAECPTVTLWPALPPFGTEDANDRWVRLGAAVLAAGDLLAGARPVCECASAAARRAARA